MPDSTVDAAVELSEAGQTEAAAEDEALVMVKNVAGGSVADAAGDVTEDDSDNPVDGADQEPRETQIIYVEDLPESGAEKSRARPPKITFRKDPVLLGAQDAARDGVLLVARQASIGPHAGAAMVGDRLATHRFECLDLGYPGWFWEVSLARAPRSKQVTVCETALVPGPDALLAPAWIPWRDRLEPSDVSRTDVLPYDAHDARLQAGFEEVDADEEELEALGEMGHGRPRVLSQYGLDIAADRWYGSPRGPVPGTRADAMCASCGFLLKIKGSMGTLFGVCANEWSPDDGQVVSFDHSCGAHSETDQPKHRSQWPLVPSRIDEEEIDIEEM